MANQARKADQVVRIDFEGQVLEARAGESLAAALTSRGIRALRTTATGAERGVFCGMGVCQDCLVEVDGRPNQRACTFKLHRSVKVRREVDRPRVMDGTASAAAAPPPPPPPPLTLDELPVKRPEVLVIGAGPGGLAAADAAALAGADVLVIDEGSTPGGQYFKQCAAESVMPPDTQHLEGRRLIDRVLARGVAVLSGATVWGAFPPTEFAVTVDGATGRIQPRATIVATGAYDRGWPVPGWTLPGVMTTGAAQTMWRTARRLPGRRVAIAGNGPLNLQLATELVAGGAEVVALVEAAPAPGLRTLREVATMLAAAPGLVAEGLRYLARCHRAGVRILHESVLASVERCPGGLRATIEGRQRADIEADVICLGYGFHPSNELLRALGCAHEFDTVGERLVTVSGPRCATSVPGVWALGDCTDLGGARVALADGAVAGFAAARFLGRELGHEASRHEAKALAGAARHRRFQRALWQLYRMNPSLKPRPTGDTLICRCEEVSYAEVEAALDGGATHPSEVKQRTRVGMGRCQARYCAPALEAFLAERTGHRRDDHSGFAPRAPVKPVAVADLANPLAE